MAVQPGPVAPGPSYAGDVVIPTASRPIWNTLDLNPARPPLTGMADRRFSTATSGTSVPQESRGASS